jgi:hypothetical protein
LALDGSRHIHASSAGIAHSHLQHNYGGAEHAPCPELHDVTFLSW